MFRVTLAAGGALQGLAFALQKLRRNGTAFSRNSRQIADSIIGLRRENDGSEFCRWESISA
jgi:hypothetical protein